MSVQIESDLKEILNRFEQRFDKLDLKLDKLSDNVTDINLRLTKVETKLDAATEDIKEIKSTQKTLSTDVSDLKGAKSLIIPIVVAVTTSILTLIIRTIPIS
jgi:chromosome segregation ATPase